LKRAAEANPRPEFETRKTKPTSTPVEADLPDDIIESDLGRATTSTDVVVWRGFHGDKPAIAVREEDGAIRIHPVILVRDYLWNTPHWDMPIRYWAAHLPPADQLAAAAVDLDGRRRDAIAATETMLHRLRQARALTAAAGQVEATRLIDIAGIRARLLAHELDRR
jgi:hypothetical protein